MIKVSSVHETEVIGETRNQIESYLVRTATEDYRTKVLDWYDKGHEGMFYIQNGDVLERWFDGI